MSTLPGIHRLLALALGTGVALAATPAGAQSNGGGTSASDTLEAPPPAVDFDSVPPGVTTMVASPGQTYPAGPLHRFLLGDLNRELWPVAFAVPVLDLDEVGGGLTVDELSGGKQTLGLRFEGEDGQTYQFRSIVKTASRAIPPILRRTVVVDAFQDQMAAQFPLSAMVVAELLETADVLVAKPRPVIMPDDPRLGEFREAFAGRMGWIEVRPNEREAPDGEEYPGFAGSPKITGSEALFEELRDDPNSYVDDRKLLRARLIDMLVGDWDRHQDQWRWASYADGVRTRWEPIPRDRDFALARIDGLIPRLAGVYWPKYVDFGAERPDVLGLHWAAQRVDRMLLSGLDRSAFREEALALQRILDDPALERAVDVLPPPYLEARREELLHALGVRRDALVEVADDFYELLAGWVDVYGTEELDSVALVPAGESLRVTLWAPREGDFVRYDRTLHASETEDVRLYLREGDDRVVIHGALPIPVRIVSSEGDDLIVDLGDGHNVRVYDDQGSNRFELGPRALETGSRYLRQDSTRTADYIWDTRDWGSAWVPRPELWFDSDIGLFAGVGLARYSFAFGLEPYHSRLSLALLNGLDASQWIASAEWERALGDRGWRTVVDIESRTHEPVWLFGFGNGVSAPGSEDDFRSFRSKASLDLGMRYKPEEHWAVRVGPELDILGEVGPSGEVFDTASVYGAGDFHQVGLKGLLEVDTRDSRQYPRSGRWWRIRAGLVPSVLDVEDTFGNVGATLSEYLSADAPGEPVLHLRLRGDKTWGRTPFFELPYLGGARSLPGFVSRRFVGTAAASGTALLRFKVLEPHVYTELEVGLHGIGTVGRVWYASDPSDAWHTGHGGGLWVRLPSIDRVVSVSLVQGDAGVRAYLDFGFLF